MDRDAFFWQVRDGKLPAPKCAATLGIVITKVDAEAGTTELEFEGRPDFLNPAGNIQGGFLAAMLDDAMGTALAATLAKSEFAPTLNLNVSFARPAKAGKILGRGRVVKRGNDVCFLSAELTQNDDLVASASATALIRKLP